MVHDGVVGYSLAGPPTGPPAALIAAAGQLAPAVLSLDVPSGLDAASGEVHEPAVRATATLTLALPKVGLRERSWASSLSVTSACPRALDAAPTLNLDVGAVFAADEVLRIW